MTPDRGERRLQGEETASRVQQHKQPRTSLAPGGPHRPHAELVVRGVVLIDARERPEDHELRDGDRVLRALQSIERAPAGATVVITVASGQTVHPGVEYARAQGCHVGQVTVVCEDAATVGRWVRGFRDGLQGLTGWCR